MKGILLWLWRRNVVTASVDAASRRVRNGWFHLHSDATSRRVYGFKSRYFVAASLMVLMALLSFVSRAEAENDVLWLYWTVDASVDQSGRNKDGIKFYGANLYVVEDGSSEATLVCTKYATGPTTTLTGENEYRPGSDQGCDLCLMGKITGYGVGARFYVELLGASLETVGWWQGDYMTMEELTTVHEALTGMVAGLQTKEPFHHVHGGEWVANQFSSVPEPTSGLLTLIGAALLALRRRKFS